MSKTSAQPLSPYSSATAKAKIETHTLSVLVDNGRAYSPEWSACSRDEAITSRA